MASSLGHLRVLELASPRIQYVGKLLGDYGADVIKVEPPVGDEARRIGPFVDDIPNPNRSIFFWHYNTSKRGVTLNLESTGGRALFKRLVATADVLIEGYNPGKLADWGLDYAALQKTNPGLIMASLTEFGQNGPWRNWQGGDLVQLAAGGVMASAGYDDPKAPPIAPGVYQSKHIGGHYLFIGILAALLERDTSGRGQYIDVAIHDAVSAVTEGAIPSWIYMKKLIHRATGIIGTRERRPRGQFLCSDGRYLNTIMPNIDVSYWHTLVAWLDSEGMAEELKDEKYLDPFVRHATLPHWLGVVGRFIEKHPSDLMYHEAQRRHITWGQVRSPEEALEDPHFHDRVFWTKVNHPEIGKSVVYPGAPFPLPEARWKISRRAPLLGEHNFEVFGTGLGLTRRKIASLAENGII